MYGMQRRWEDTEENRGTSNLHVLDSQLNPDHGDGVCTEANESASAQPLSSLVKSSDELHDWNGGGSNTGQEAEGRRGVGWVAEGRERRALGGSSDAGELATPFPSPQKAR